MGQQFIRVGQNIRQIVGYNGVFCIQIGLLVGSGFVSCQTFLNAFLGGDFSSCFRFEVLRGQGLYLGYRENGRRNDGGIVGAVALHISYKCLAQFLGIGPAVSGVGSAGFENDLSHFVIGVFRGREHLCRCIALERQGIVIVCLIQDQTDGVDVQGGIQCSKGVCHFRSGVAAAVLIRHGRILQR